jgi:4-amino-4-deoxy-L-arabinose transferase-like glycosyltransferase
VRFVKTRFVRASQEPVLSDSGMDRHWNLALAIGLIAVAIRLIAINQPFIDQWSWRQSDVAAIARNYFQGGFHFAYPRIDWAGDQPGYVGTEFPILPFIAAICYKFGGVHEWIGRIQAVILFAVSLPFFFLLVRGIFGATAATWALLFYGFSPLSVMTSRCFMPDMPSLSLSIVGLYFFQRWLANDRSTSLFAAAALTSLSILIKAPAAIIGAPLAYLAFQRFGFSAWRRIELWIFAPMALLPSALWYWHAHQIAEKFYPHHFFGAGGIQIMNFIWYKNIFEQISKSELGPLIGFLAIFGVWILRRVKGARFLYAWLVAVILLILIVGYGNRHAWYRLPLVPIAAAFAGGTCDVIRQRVSPRLTTRISLSILALVLMAVFLIGNLKILYRPAAGSLRDAGLELKRTTPANSLIVAADNGDPTIFYYAERKGWHFLEKDGIYEGNPLDSEQVITDLAKLRQHGATHLVFTANTIWWLDYYREFAEHLLKAATTLEETSQFRILKLSSATEKQNDKPYDSSGVR